MQSTTSTISTYSAVMVVIPTVVVDCDYIFSWSNPGSLVYDISTLSFDPRKLNRHQIRQWVVHNPSSPSRIAYRPLQWIYMYIYNIRILSNPPYLRYDMSHAHPELYFSVTVLVRKLWTLYIVLYCPYFDYTVCINKKETGTNMSISLKVDKTSVGIIVGIIY